MQFPVRILGSCNIYVLVDHSGCFRWWCIFWYINKVANHLLRVNFKLKCIRCFNLSILLNKLGWKNNHDSSIRCVIGVFMRIGYLERWCWGVDTDQHDYQKFSGFYSPYKLSLCSRSIYRLIIDMKMVVFNSWAKNLLLPSNSWISLLWCKEVLWLYQAILKKENHFLPLID